MKKDDSLFLMCNICDRSYLEIIEKAMKFTINLFFSVYPKKCFVNFRKHLVEAHTDRVVEIFRCE